MLWVDYSKTLYVAVLPCLLRSGHKKSNVTRDEQNHWEPQYISISINITKPTYKRIPKVPVKNKISLSYLPLPALSSSRSSWYPWVHVMKNGGSTNCQSSWRSRLGWSHWRCCFFQPQDPRSNFGPVGMVRSLNIQVLMECFIMFYDRISYSTISYVLCIYRTISILYIHAYSLVLIDFKN